MKIRPRHHSEKGQSYVEMAVSITILFILLAGLLDTGSLFFSYMALRDAAAEGTNYGMYRPLDLTGIEARVRASSSQQVDLEDSSHVAVTIIEDPDPCVGKTIKVRVTYQFGIDTPLVGAVIGSQAIPISAESSATILSQTCTLP